MNDVVKIALLASLVLAASAPQRALACTDGGPPNRTCSDGGAAWTPCNYHSDCPEGQVCAESGVCACPGWCQTGEQECTDEGCRCCGDRSTTTCFVRFECPDRDAGEPDAGTSSDPRDAGVALPMDATIDAGPDAGESGGCNAGRTARTPWAWLVAIALVIAARRRDRRS